jgi:SAM-dependent methyltransferase
MTIREWLSLRVIYAQAGRAEALPWHRDEPAKLLSEIISARGDPGRALDIGCGSGVDSVYMAQNGWDVTSLDFMPDALRMARERARQARVNITTIQADALEWDAPADTFDLIVDIGCLHSKTGAARRIYRDKIISMLKRGGDYLLLHFERRHFFDWRPVGPRRRTRAQIHTLFEPELIEKQHVRNSMRGPTPLIGLHSSSISYWFR